MTTNLTIWSQNVTIPEGTPVPNPPRIDFRFIKIREIARSVNELNILLDEEKEISEFLEGLKKSPYAIPQYIAIEEKSLQYCRIEVREERNDLKDLLKKELKQMREWIQKLEVVGEVEGTVAEGSNKDGRA